MKITLRRNSTGWTAQYHDDAAILEAFGTDTIPAPFTAQAPFEMVCKAIQSSNPTATIEEGV